ncbi:MAG: hypothetical protein ACO3I4_07260 [Candidatus Kapaibacteriota bacterium]
MRGSIALVLLSVLMVAVMDVSAQSKKQEGLVVGLETGQAIGAVALYQLNENLQIGSGVGVQVGDATVIYLSPQVRFLTPIGIADLQAVAEAQLYLTFGDVSRTAVQVRGSVQKWISEDFAVYGGVSLVTLNLDPSVIAIGLLTPHLGVQVRL